MPGLESTEPTFTTPRGGTKKWRPSSQSPARSRAFLALSWQQPPPALPFNIKLTRALWCMANLAHQSSGVSLRELQPSARTAALVVLGSVNFEGEWSQDSQS